MLKSYLRYTWFIVLMVFLVILAGGVVRMTQSGMGCPDWPKCFGRWVPPVSADQLPADFEKYLSKQDIDHTFNAYHTWIEYINRLLGALLGIFIFIHFIWSYRKFRKSDKIIVLISFLLLIAVAFQGWLGKQVVDHNLEVVKVTTHMLVALIIAALPLMIIYRIKRDQRIAQPFIRNVSLIVLLLVIIQIVLGTQVREQIDEISRGLNYEQRDLWIGKLDNMFFIHRSFSWVILAACILLLWKAWPFRALRNTNYIILVTVIATILAGVSMAFYNVPAISQPLHLLLACILTLSLFVLRLRVK